MPSLLYRTSSLLTCPISCVATPPNSFSEAVDFLDTRYDPFIVSSYATDCLEANHPNTLGPNTAGRNFLGVACGQREGASTAQAKQPRSLFQNPSGMRLYFPLNKRYHDSLDTSLPNTLQTPDSIRQMLSRLLVVPLLQYAWYLLRAVRRTRKRNLLPNAQSNGFLFLMRLHR